MAYDTPRGGTNRLGFVGLDHTTSNFATLGHIALWLEHVLGFDRFWEIQFHTTDVDPDHEHGSGLRSLVYWDPGSGVKFANNEPWRPNYRASQINVFVEELRGPGSSTGDRGGKDIIPAVRCCASAARGLLRRAAPGVAQEAPAWARSTRTSRAARAQIPVDGDGPGKYLLQIFLKESSGLYSEAAAAPFLRDHPEEATRASGAGNFRALFRVDRARPGSVSSSRRSSRRALAPRCRASVEWMRTVREVAGAWVHPAMDGPEPRPGATPSLEAELVRPRGPATAPPTGGFTIASRRWSNGVLLARACRGRTWTTSFHDVFLQAMRRLASLRGPEAFPAGWPRSRAQPRAITGAAASTSAPLPADVAGAPTPRATLAVLALIQRLPEAYRETLVLRLVEGMTGPEIAERTGLTPGSVRVNLHRGLQLLRDALSRRDRT